MHPEMQKHAWRRRERRSRLGENTFLVVKIKETGVMKLSEAVVAFDRKLANIQEAEQRSREDAGRSAKLCMDRLLPWLDLPYRDLGVYGAMRGDDVVAGYRIALEGPYGSVVVECVSGEDKFFISRNDRQVNRVAHDPRVAVVDIAELMRNSFAK